MSRKRQKKTLQRAVSYAPTPSGSLYTLPAGAIQSSYGQTFYGGSAKNAPTQGDALFSPGVPLAPIQGVNPKGLPVGWRFPVAYNTMPVDRSMGDTNIPSFQQLRMLAKMFYGIGLCERAWFDLVPRMELNVKLTDEAIVGGAEPKQYQQEIAYFKNFFSKPDGKRDIHTWLRMALREQTQIDELYLYKNRTRGGKLLGLTLVAGDQMKPLLDEWGQLPDAPQYAYQQYPWGIPGMQYTTEQMIHYQESPATDTPYGLSRIERIILVVNLALKKMKKDLAHYASGNIPSGIMEVPPDPNWTPDQIDSYEQMWNALLAGNLSKQVQVKFTQPGMKYTKLDDFSPDTPFDEFLLNVSVAAYGLSMQDLAFTENIHKSSGDSQQNMTYRRTIDPLAVVYARILTECMHEDFEPSLHGDLLKVTFGGFDEHEDEQAQAATLTMYTNAGILGLSDAAKLAGLPEDPGTPHIGRVYMSKDGPVFLDDMASDDMRDAAKQAKIAGFQMAANPPEQQQGEDTDNGATQNATNAKAGKNSKTPGKSNASTTQKDITEAGNTDSKTRGLEAETIRDISDRQADASNDYRRWRQRAIEDKKANRAYRGFTTTLIPSDIHARISTELAQCETVQDVREVFERARQHEIPAHPRELATDIAALFEDVERRGKKAIPV